MKRLRILVSLITEDNDYQLEQAASAQAAALKLGASVQTFIPATMRSSKPNRFLASFRIRPSVPMPFWPNR